MEAIEAVEAAGRLPREAVLAGNATLDELIELLVSCKPDRAARPRFEPAAQRDRNRRG